MVEEAEARRGEIHHLGGGLEPRSDFSAASFHGGGGPGLFDNFQLALWKAASGALACCWILDSWSKHFPESTLAEKWELEADKGKPPSLGIP